MYEVNEIKVNNDEYYYLTGKPERIGDKCIIVVNKKDERIAILLEFEGAGMHLVDMKNSEAFPFEHS